MKKILALTLAAVITLLSITAVLAADTAMIGDFNGNGKIDADDYILLKRVYFGTAALDEAQEAIADIDGNGEIDADDYILLKRAYFGSYEIRDNASDSNTSADVSADISTDDYSDASSDASVDNSDSNSEQLPDDSTADSSEESSENPFESLFPGISLPDFSFPDFSFPDGNESSESTESSEPENAVPTEAEVYETLIGLQDEYPEGMAWTNDNMYAWNGSNTVGYGCVAFAFTLSDAAFGELPATEHTDTSNIRVGDILRINNDTHSVIVLKVEGNNITIAEGNYNSSVHWGRVLKLSSTQIDYILTRYPA